MSNTQNLDPCPLKRRVRRLCPCCHVVLPVFIEDKHGFDWLCEDCRRVMDNIDKITMMPPNA